MSQDRLQLQRLELKYIIKEEVALAVRDFVSSYLEIDEYGATRPNLSYPVHSLYLDSDEMLLYWHTINGNKNRFKMRIRFYENSPKAPVFLEIKRRMNNAIMKQRGSIVREAVGNVLAGQMPDDSQMLSKDPKQIVAIQNFIRFTTECGFKPKAHVAYEREAWLYRSDNSVRVTIDRNVRIEPDLAGRMYVEMENPTYVFGKMAVLELKFTGRFPEWFGELVRIFGLVQCSAAKYADGVALVGESRFNGHMFNPVNDVAMQRLKARREALEKKCGSALFTAEGFA